jgi:proton-dependent oligopeptide transporter, POT family
MSHIVENNIIKGSEMPKQFWVLWMIELWERFGYYGMQAILALYFVHELGYTEKESMYLFGTFAAFVYGFIWVGGYIGDHYLGAKRAIIIGAIILAISYASMAVATKGAVYFSLAGIVVGNALFKANPSSLISKLYKKGDTALDGAMTLYYMAINIGAFISMAITPIVAANFGWGYAFAICSIGLFLGTASFFMFYRVLDNVYTDAGKNPLKVARLALVIAGSIISVIIIGILLPHTAVCTAIVFVVVVGAFFKFFNIALSLESREKKRMLVAFVLLFQGVVFFVLYNQMPTSLTFFAVHNVNNHLFGLTIPAAEYQVLNPFWIVLMSPVLAWVYIRSRSTHITKFCIGMTLCSLAFLVLWIPQFIATEGVISPFWMVLTYWLQSTGELLISGLGLAMVAELCPRNISGFVMGIWLITSMLAGPIGAYVGALTQPDGVEAMTAVQTLHIYGNVFAEIGIATAIITILMWMSRPFLNRVIQGSKYNEIPANSASVNV